MLVHWIPDALVRLFARPYVAGGSLEEALDAAARLYREAGMLTTLDLLAEEVRSEQRIHENREAYRQLLEALARDERFSAREVRPSVSLKLSSFTLDPMDRGGDARGSRESVRAIAEQARQLGIALTVDMEGHEWTDFTLGVAFELFRDGFDVGTVLQSRLLRTDADVEQIPQGMRIRMVIGIYPEPAHIAVTDKRQMKERLVAQSERLLQRGVYVEFATHDEVYLRKFLGEVVRRGEIASSRYEIQMLFGVPRGKILHEIRSGLLGAPGAGSPPVRLYVPYATAWDQATAYCRRRLQENPALAVYVTRNLFHSLLGKHRAPPGSEPSGNGAQ